jgi:hypothetical protein
MEIAVSTVSHRRCQHGESSSILSLACCSCNCVHILNFNEAMVNLDRGINHLTVFGADRCTKRGNIVDFSR